MYRTIKQFVAIKLMCSTLTSRNNTEYRQHILQGITLSTDIPKTKLF